MSEASARRAHWCSRSSGPPPGTRSRRPARTRPDHQQRVSGGGSRDDRHAAGVGEGGRGDQQGPRSRAQPQPPVPRPSRSGRRARRRVRASLRMAARRDVRRPCRRPSSATACDPRRGVPATPASSLITCERSRFTPAVRDVPHRRPRPGFRSRPCARTVSGPCALSSSNPSPIVAASQSPWPRRDPGDRRSPVEFRRRPPTGSSPSPGSGRARFRAARRRSSPPWRRDSASTPRWSRASATTVRRRVRGPHARRRRRRRRPSARYPGAAPRWPSSPTSLGRARLLVLRARLRRRGRGPGRPRRRGARRGLAHVCGSTLAFGGHGRRRRRRPRQRCSAPAGASRWTRTCGPTRAPRRGPAPRELAAVADVLFPSDGELEALGISRPRSSPPAAPWSATRSGAGGAARRRAMGHEPVRVPAPPAEEVDPTGAGDTFAAAFVAATRAGRDPVAAARLGVRGRGPLGGRPRCDGAAGRARGSRQRSEVLSRACQVCICHTKMGHVQT